jgi:cyclopropane fatty-acyl-phospholipid synthase-like methyltransferase
MADAGATVTALDVDDYSQEFLSAVRQAGWDDRCSFLQQDITKFKVADNLEPFHVIVCQRMIHYVSYATALEIVADLRRTLTEDGRLYISASGLHSELGNGYPERSKPVSQRYAALSDEMSSRHAIKGPVCLYSVADLARLLEDAGMLVEQVFASPFGNIKAVAKP